MFRWLRELFAPQVEYQAALCRDEEEDDDTGSLWYCTLLAGHAGVHETWINGVQRHQWPRSLRDAERD